MTFLKYLNVASQSERPKLPIKILYSSVSTIHSSVYFAFSITIAPEGWAASKNFVQSHSDKTEPQRVNLVVHMEH